MEVLLRNSTRERLDDYYQAWNDPSNASGIIGWHDNFRYSSPWVLPKLVRHVFQDSNVANKVEDVVDFFDNLVMKSETVEKFDLCAGLHELVHQMKKSGDYEKQTLKVAVQNLFPEPSQQHQYFLRIKKVLYGICQTVM